MILITKFIMDRVVKKVKREEKDPLIVVVTGAAGQIAYSFYGLLCIKIKRSLQYNNNIQFHYSI